MIRRYRDSFAFWALATIVVLNWLPWAAAQTPTHNDVVFANTTADDGTPFPLRMDIWESTAATERAPLVMWIHGGGWQGGTYNNPPPGLQSFLNAGYAVASVQYRLSGTSIFPAQIHDVKGAVRFLRAHSDDYGIDASRVAAFGSSAGGHLTALLAISGDVPELEGTIGGNLEFSSRLQGAIDYFGPTDLLNMNPDVTTPPGSVIDHDAANSPESQLIGFDAAGQGMGVLRANLTNPAAPYPTKAALVTLASPITHVTADDPPMFIAHGNLDNVVPQKQSVRLADALAAAEIEHVYRVVVGAGHGFGNQSTTVNAEAIAFLTHAFDRVAGDFNGDQRVDQEDYYVWKGDFGSNRAAADANGNGFVDAGDYTIWRDHFDANSEELFESTNTVPEPIAGHMFIAWLFLARSLRGR
jgi:acetyl esterase/lipase